jgi:K+-sensing histidine kinase KdpD
MRKKHLIYVLRMCAVMLSIFLLSILLNRVGIGRENILMLFMVGVLLVAYCTNGYQYGIIASVVSMMSFNYLFTEPFGTFSISDQDDMIMLAFFLLSALISTNLTVRFQQQVQVARENEQRARTLEKEQERIQFAMEKEQLRSGLLRSISHDLRTPLTGIAGASSLIAETGQQLDRDSIVSLAKDINDQADWLIQLVENILNMTKIDSGKLVIEKNPEAVEDIISNAVSHVRSRSQERAIEVDVADNVFIVPMDGKMMVQVLINLLDNAIKHTQEDGRITIRVWQEEDLVWFAVEDDGTGIEDSVRDHLFEEFITARPGGKDTGKGIGLGLAICRAIVNAHGGTIRAENRELSDAASHGISDSENRELSDAASHGISDSKNRELNDAASHGINSAENRKTGGARFVFSLPAKEKE